MRVVTIHEKLEEMGVSLENDIVLGDFDLIGEFTAKKRRDPSSELYKSAGCFFRPNYERGILVYSLITKYNLSSFLEIGHGRGYSTFCAAMAFAKNGVEGRIVTVDPQFDDQLLQHLQRVFPIDWFKMVSFAKGMSSDVVPDLQEMFDLIVIDGDHSEAGVEIDWINTKEKFNRFLIFDDYHLPPKFNPNIQVTPVVDRIEGYTKEAIVMDRQIFQDDRNLDEVLDAQVLITR